MSWQCPACGSQADVGHACYTPDGRDTETESLVASLRASLSRVTAERDEAREERLELAQFVVNSDSISSDSAVKLASRIVAEADHE